MASTALVGRPVVDDPEACRQVGDRFCLTDSVDRAMGFYGLRDGRLAVFAVHRAAAPSLPAAAVDQGVGRERAVLVRLRRRGDDRPVAREIHGRGRSRDSGQAAQQQGRDGGQRGGAEQAAGAAPGAGCAPRGRAGRAR